MKPCRREPTKQTNQFDELTQHGNITNNKQHSDADKEKAESENLEELGAEGEKEVLEETGNMEIAEELNTPDKEKRRSQKKDKDTPTEEGGEENEEEEKLDDTNQKEADTNNILDQQSWAKKGQGPIGQLFVCKHKKRILLTKCTVSDERMTIKGVEATLQKTFLTSIFGKTRRTEQQS